MNRSWFVTALGVALGVSCSSPTETPLGQLNLDRPVDIAFACHGKMRVTSGAAATADQEIITTAQPAAACEAWSPQVAPLPDPDPNKQTLQPVPGQENVPGQPNTPQQEQQDQAIGIPSWYGFILQPSSGTVALAAWPSKPSYDPIDLNQVESNDVVVLDADPLTPGNNAISVGEEPIAIVTDTSGCYEITANAGSCDLSVLDINSVLDRDPGVRLERRPVKSKIGTPILARPAAMVVEPNKNVGYACPTKSEGLVYIAYPSCHLVAGVDASSGEIVSGVQYDNAGVPHVMTDTDLTTLSCPDECPDEKGMLGHGPVTDGVRPVALDLEVTPDLASGTGEKTQLAIGSQHSASVTVVEIDRTTSPTRLLAPKHLALEDKLGTLGITSVALTPQIGMGNNHNNATVTDLSDPCEPPPPPPPPPGPPPGGFGQYVYAVATDSTVRVVDILNLNRECDTQIDTRFVRKLTGNTNVPALQCFPVGDPANPRRIGAKGPGIELIGDAVPTSVAIIKGLDEPLIHAERDVCPVDPTKPNDPVKNIIKIEQIPPTQNTLIGYFAIITASNGRSFVVNVDDDNENGPDVFKNSDPLTTAPVFAMAHQLRDSFNISTRDATSKRSVTTKVPGKDDQHDDLPSCTLPDPLPTEGGANAGGPRATSAPARGVTTGGPIASTKVAELPTLRQLSCTGFDGPLSDTQSNTEITSAISEVQLGAPEDTRDQVFPDLRSLASEENWSLTWEGTLSLDSTVSAVDGPVVRTGTMTVDAFGMHLNDPAKPFCAMGVEPFDIVNLRGCNPMNGDLDCPSGYQCFVHPESKVAIGACMLKTEASRLANACRDFLISFRNYTVGREPGVTSDKLLLLPRKHVLRTTPIDGCTSNLQCQDLANYAAQNANADIVDLHPNGNNLDPHTWECKADNDRANPTQKRCVQTCGYYPDPKNRDDDCGITVGDQEVKMICQGATPTDRGICMEGVTPPPSCVTGPQRFDVRASEAFTVVGSHSGYIHSIIEEGGVCKAAAPAPGVPPLLRGRIPLSPPQCNLAANPFTGEISPGVFEANPCSLPMVQHAESQPNYIPGTCKVPDSPTPDNPQTIVVQRNAPAIQFRNPGLKLTLVDPYYFGDQVCPRDGRGVTIDGQTSVKIPLVYTGYSLSFAQKAGFNPMILPSINPAFPVKTVPGPSNSIWVLDNGDFLSNGIEPSTRGKVFRLESTRLQVINLLN